MLLDGEVLAVDLRKKTIQLLRQYKILPKKRFGQSFSINSILLNNVISYASISKKDIVLEVGTGLGFLTRLLAQRCKKVVAVEIDPNLIDISKKQTVGLQNIEFIEGDILRVSTPPFNKMVSIPPYSISSPLLFWLLEKNFDLAVMVFQEEFAERLIAPVGSKRYGRLTVNIYYKAEVDLLDSVPRKMFYPPPTVDSLIVRLKPRKFPFYIEDKKLLFELTRILFNQRNRKVRKVILNFMRERGITKATLGKLVSSLPFHDKRVRELTPEDFCVLAQEILKKVQAINGTNI
jgi:16S rRNA (adenine1518-N6/adenine1519-N6)-dimethyltransferase